MRIVSYFNLAPKSHHFRFWETGIGKALPSALGDVVYKPLNSSSGKPSFDDTSYDIAYLHMWSVIPSRRPAKFVYSFVSDVVGYERKIKTWIRKARPDLLACLQCCPNWLINFGKEYGCRVELLPWFVVDLPPKKKKTVTGMSSGCINQNYPRRTKIFRYLESLNRGDLILSGSGNFGHYPLSNEKYREAISSCKYYLSGGILDRFIPPKYYEVCSHGACLVSHGLPRMEECGFVDRETYIRVNSLKEIPDILNSDLWEKIGSASRELVRQRHMVHHRAKRILEIYHEG